MVSFANVPETIYFDVVMVTPMAVVMVHGALLSLNYSQPMGMMKPQLMFHPILHHMCAVVAVVVGLCNPSQIKLEHTQFNRIRI